MKNKILKINLILSLILGFQLSARGQGIPEGIDTPLFMVPTNQTWSFIKYGGSPGELYTGTVGTSIPVFEYKDRDFTIPVSLNYASGGYMPNRAVGIVGNGWYLNIGGTITREVQGFPDDRNIRHSDPDEEGNVCYLGYFCRQMSEFNNSGRQLGEEWLIPGNHLVTFAEWAEVENDPDIFHFSFMGHTGSFTNYGESTICYNTSGPANEYKVITYTNLNTNSDWWENVPFSRPSYVPGDKLYEQDRLQTIYIITGDGLRYQFKALEKNQRSMFADYDIPLKMTWYLTRITAPNGREVIFSYQEGRETTTTTPRANNVSYSETQPGITTAGGATSSQTYCPYYLSSIKIKDDASYSDTDSRNRTLVTLSYTESEMISLVQNIRIGKDGNGTDKTYSFAYTTYGQGIAKTPFLTRLGTPVGNYRFNYMDTATGSFHNNRRSTACFNIDHWGFYNGKTNTNSSYIPTGSIDINYNEIITGTSRDANFTMARKGMLHTIFYPAGGKTEFEYEPHTYSREVVRNSVADSNGKTFYPRLAAVSGTPKVIGGVRLKSIKDYDVSGTAYTLAKEKQYTYTNNDSQSSGILLKSPRYRIQYRITGRRKEHYSTQPVSFNGLINMADESFFPATYDKTHIEYTQVKETNLDGSYTTYKFSNYETNPDVMPSNYEISDRYTNSGSTYYMKISTSGNDNGITYSPAIRNYVNNLLLEPMSMHNYRGKTKSVGHYNNTNNLVENTDYFYWYENSNDPNCQEYDVRSGDVIYIKKIPVESRPLVKTVTTQSGVTHKAEHTYNHYGRITRTSQQQSDGSYYITLVKYPGDNDVSGYNDLVNNHLLSLPVRNEVRLRKPGATSDELVSRTDYIYARTGSGSNLDYAVTEIKSKTFDPPRSTEVSQSELETEIRFEYDEKGKLRQSTDRNGKKTTYLWGYTRKHLIAIIENAGFAQVQAVLGATKVNNLAAGVPTDAEINSLWTQLKNAPQIPGSQVSVATYKTHAGITSMTDASGRKSYYEYNGKDQLTFVKDEDGNIIENYSYHLRSN